MAIRTLRTQGLYGPQFAYALHTSTVSPLPASAFAEGDHSFIRLAAHGECAHSQA